MKTTGEIIKELRLAHGLSKKRLAEILELKSYTTVSKWETNENHPRGKEIKILCNLFNVSADYLLGLKENNELKSFPYKYFPIAISAGLPIGIEPVTNAETILIPDDLMGKYARRKDIYFLRVNGESMNKVIPHGSLIAVKQIEVENLKNGDIVVYSNGHDYAVKRFYQTEDKFIFRPESYDPVFTDYIIEKADSEELRLHGKVIAYIVNLD